MKNPPSRLHVNLQGTNKNELREEWLFIYTEECCLGLTVYKLALVNVPLF